MKKSYSTPSLVAFGTVSELTGVIGGSEQADVAKINGVLVSGNNDLGSQDICIVNGQYVGADC